jgi:hypothetical protein
VLVVEAADAFASVTLNSMPLGTRRWPDFPARFDIRRLLQPRNELAIDAIDVELPRIEHHGAPLPRPPGRESAAAGGLIGDVYLEITSNRRER